jgi:hypothetical protein
MAPAQSGSTWDDNFLDLTLEDSPEPESRPLPQARARAQAQSRTPLQQARLVFERERQPYEMSRVKDEAGQPAVAARSPVAPQEPRPIHPDHLSEIIKTTNPYALEQVILELCRASPALSNALVRGLAPHSSAAQAMINQHQKTLQKPKANISEHEDSDDVYELTKNRLAARPTVPGPSSSRHPSLPRKDGSSHLTPPPPRGSQSVPRVKQESQHVHTISDSDEDLRLPSHPRTAPRPPPTRTPLKHLSSSSTAANRTPGPVPFIQKLANSKKLPVPVARTCINCHEPYQDEDGVCLYHAGKLARGNDGMIIWDCCHEESDYPGCQPGIHTTKKQEEEEEEVFSQQKRPSVSPGPSGAPRKRPRV